MKIKFLLLLLSTALLNTAQATQNTTLIQRILGERSSEFVTQEIPQDQGKDVYEIESVDGKIVLRGNNGVSVASAFNAYLRDYCNAHVSWNCGDQLNLPKTLPIVPSKVRVVTEYPSRFCYMGPDTLVVLNDIPDSLSESGDREMRMIFQDREGEILRVEDFTGVLHRGLAWDGEFLFSCGDADDGSSILYRIEPDTLMVEEAFDAPGNHPCGMCFDGRFVWITDRDTGRVDRFDNEVGEITRSVVTPGFSPFGVAFDGKYMWIADSGSGRMYRLTGARRRWSATVDTDSYMMRGDDVLLLHDGESFWYVPEGENLAIRIQMP